MSVFKSLSSKIFALMALAMMLLPSPANAEPTRLDDTEIGTKLNLPVYKWQDKSVQQKGIIFAIHGATLYARRFEAAARHFASEGYTFYAVDLRGFGRWRTEGERFQGGDRKIHYTESEDDILAVLQQIRARNPQEKIYCMGESLGANLGVWVGSTHPDLVSGLILVSPCIRSTFHPSFRSYWFAFRGFLDPDEKQNLAANIRPFLCDDQSATDEYLNDPGINHVLSAKELVKSLKTNTIAIESKEKIPASMPVLIVAGEKDQIYKASAIPPFADEMGSKHKTIDIIPKRGHLLVEYDRVTPEVLGLIDKWLDSNDSKQPNDIATDSSPNRKTVESAAAN
ncbi:MAG TPA: alpha/beta fold hydrolase [Planktothrix sp.]|jgi:alpha-beta hydrolase superfamily lysophospholipase